MKKVRAEVSLAAWAYNLKRALAVLGLEKLLAAVGKRTGSAGSPGETAEACGRGACRRAAHWDGRSRRGQAAGWCPTPPDPVFCFSYRL